MDAQSHRFVRLTLFAGSFALATLVVLGSKSSHALAIDHPMPSDTSTRKGAIATEPSVQVESSTDEDAKHEAVKKVQPEPKATSVTRRSAQANVTLAQWVSDWMKNPRKVTAKLAIHGVVPEIELEAVIPAAAQQRICANGKCYDVDEKEVQGQPCDQQELKETTTQEEQISEAPAAPPIPPSFPFAFQGDSQDGSILELQIDGGPYSQGSLAGEYPQDRSASGDIYGDLSDVQIAVPASTLVAYMVAHAENSIRLEMTEQIAAERAMYAQRYELLLQHNQQLQTQLAVLEARQQTTEAMALRASGRQLASKSSAEAYNSGEAIEDKRCQSLTASKEDWDAIQEDLSNIRRQIAILKKSNPIPFAASGIGTEESTVPQGVTAPNAMGSKQPQAWRTARSTPYVPVFPSVGKTSETTKK